MCPHRGLFRIKKRLYLCETEFSSVVGHKRVLEHQLASELPEISATDAFAAMKSVGIAELEFNGQSRRLVSVGGRDARRIAAALGIRDLAPPTPENTGPERQKTQM